MFKTRAVLINLVGGPLDGTKAEVLPDMWHGDAQFEIRITLADGSEVARVMRQSPAETSPVRAKYTMTRIVCTYEMTGEPHTARFREATT